MAAVSVLFVVGVAVLFVWPIPRYLRLSPGHSPDVDGLIKVEGVQTYENPRHLGVALVLVAPVDNLFELTRAHLDSDSAVHPRDVYIPPNVSDADNDKQNQSLQATSQQVATAVALRFLGYEVKITGKGAQVNTVDPDKPAAGVLQVSDVIVQVDGQPIATVEDVQRLVQSRAPGVPVRLRIQRAGSEQDVEVGTVPAPDDPARPIMGVTLATWEPRYEFPGGFTVEIDAGGIGGPSAGLIYAIGIIDTLTPGDITGGYDIAATGEIRSDGTVGQVGGLREKTIGVERAGAEFFLVPAGDASLAEAQGAADRIQVVPVATVQEALDFLKGLRKGEELQLPAK